MDLHVLPERTADAAGNMAVDFLLLQRYADGGAARFRHYTWRRPAFTFGYAQAIAEVRTRLPAGESIDLTRRATGGGIVDHRHDWTYALVLPRVHPLFDRPGPVIYRAIHEAVANALGGLGADIRLHGTAPETDPGLCFERSEVGDIVRADSGQKVAGAALKRARHGILLQGSISRPAVPEISDWTPFEDRLSHQLACALDATVSHPGWPAFNPEEEEALIEQYCATEWIERR